jgi:prepilin-type N-terminal cleavage/methylation domain-containing protein
MNRSYKRNSSRGWDEQAFTLLELLISMTILSVIIVIILSGFHIGTRSWETGEQRVEKNQRLRIAAIQLREEIRSAFALKVKGMVDEIEKPFSAFVGESDSLKFITSTAGLVPNPVGTKLRAVYYEVSSEGLVAWESYLNFEDFFDDPESVGEEIIVNPDVTDISFRYCDYIEGEEEEEEAEPEEVLMWVDSWDPINDLIEKAKMEHEDDKEEKDKIDYQKLPRAVEVTLTLKPETENGVDLGLPPLIIPIATGHIIDIKNSDEG